MSRSLEQLRNHFDSQLDLTLSLAKASGSYAERLVAAHFTMLQGLLQKASLPENPSSEHSWNSLSERRNILVGYCKTCMREGLDYQMQVLSELSRK